MNEALERLSGGPPPAYLFIDREERHLAAILFYILNLPEAQNITKILRLAGCEWLIKPDEFGIYFEFSYLRDLWHNVGGRTNDRKRRFIIDTLRKGCFSPSILKRLDLLGVREFNRIFIGGDRGSHDYIQSPANWQLTTFLKSLQDDYNCSTQDIVVACKLKWGFRVKPDIVIQPDKTRALCLELKLEARESRYPALGSEKKCLRERGVTELRLSQTEIQRYMMTDLLGLDSRHLIIRKYSGQKSDIISWNDLLKRLDRRGLPNFMDEAIKRATSLGVSREEDEGDEPE